MGTTRAAITHDQQAAQPRPNRRLRVRCMGKDSLSMVPSRVRRCIGTLAIVTCNP